MNGPRDQLLASSTFTENEHGIGVLGDLLDQPVNALHFGRSSDQAAKTRACAELFAKHAVFLIHIEEAHDAVQLSAQIGNMKRLSDIVGGTDARGLHRIFDRAVLCEDNHRGLGIELPYAFEQLQAAQFRDAEIGKHNIHRILVHNLESLLRGGSNSRAQT
jgi:hypothetical protein